MNETITIGMDLGDKYPIATVIDIDGNGLDTRIFSQMVGRKGSRIQDAAAQIACNPPTLSKNRSIS